MITPFPIVTLLPFGVIKAIIRKNNGIVYICEKEHSFLMKTDALLQGVGISKWFGPVKALDNVNFRVGHNEIVGLVGDNGAGKSTLVKIFSGVYPPTEGDIFIEGEKIRYRSSIEARNKGIETIYQDLAIIEDLPIFRNIFLAKELTYGPLRLLDQKRMRTEAQRGLEELKIIMPPVNESVRFLSGGQRQVVAVSRALIRDARLTFMDEPTAALGVAESRQVLEIIKSLKAKGRSAVVVAHNLRHVMSVCDRLVVLRMGKVVSELNSGDVSVDEVEEIIVGHEKGVDSEKAAA
jgi:ABC-type sugar transport system ATPase subunit